MTEGYPRGGDQSGAQDPLRFWIEQVGDTMGQGERKPDGPPPADSTEHQLYSALMNEVVYGVPYSSYFVVDPGGRTRFTDPREGAPVEPGEVPPSITADRLLCEGINHLSMEGRRLHVQHVTHNSSSQPLNYANVNFTRLARGLARKGGVLYIDPPLAELTREAKITGLSVDSNDRLQTMLNTVATRVNYGFLTDAQTVGKIEDEVQDILPVIGEQMGLSMLYLAEQIRGTGVEVQLLGMARPKESSILIRDMRRELAELMENGGAADIGPRIEAIRLALSLRNYTEWHLLGEMGADLAQRSQKRRVREAAIVTTDQYGNLSHKLDDSGVRVDILGVLAASRLQICGRRGFIDPIDMMMVLRQEQ
jgi:hypothetical protein